MAKKNVKKSVKKTGNGANTVSDAPCLCEKTRIWKILAKKSMEDGKIIAVGSLKRGISTPEFAEFQSLMEKKRKIILKKENEKIHVYASWHKGYTFLYIPELHKRLCIKMDMPEEDISDFVVNEKWRKASANSKTTEDIYSQW